MEELINQYNYKSTLQKMMRICSTQEKCKFDISSKLKKWEISEDIIQKIILKLEEENFIDEARYSQAFVNDKFKFNKWGKIKIKYELRKKQINRVIIDNALETISNEDYHNTAKEILKTKLKQLKNTIKFEVKSKLIRYAYAKGFEQDVIYKILDDLLENNSHFN